MKFKSLRNTLRTWLGVEIIEPGWGGVFRRSIGESITDLSNRLHKLSEHTTVGFDAMHKSVSDSFAELRQERADEREKAPELPACPICHATLHRWQYRRVAVGGDGLSAEVHSCCIGEAGKHGWILAQPEHGTRVHKVYSEGGHTPDCPGCKTTAALETSHSFDDAVRRGKQPAMKPEFQFAEWQALVKRVDALVTRADAAIELHRSQIRHVNRRVDKIEQYNRDNVTPAQVEEPANSKWLNWGRRSATSLVWPGPEKRRTLAKRACDEFMDELAPKPDDHNWD